MKYLMRDYIYGWHWENFKASYEHGNSAIFNFLAVQLIFVAQIIKTAGWAQLVIASGYFIGIIRSGNPGIHTPVRVACPFIQ